MLRARSSFRCARHAAAHEFASAGASRARDRHAEELDKARAAIEHSDQTSRTPLTGDKRLPSNEDSSAFGDV